MKLAKALKEKNRLAGEVKRLQNLFSRENSKDVKSTSKVDVAKVNQDLSVATEKLIAIKTAIFKANAGIYEKIVRMGELKSRISFLEMVNTEDGVEEIVRGMGQPLVKETKAWMNQEAKDAEVVKLQNEIAALQDQIDEYNATVEVN